LAIAENSKVEFISFESNAVGKVDQLEGKYMVTEIVLKPKVVVPSTAHQDRMLRILEMSEKACLISNSINSKIIFEPTVILSK